MQTRLASNLEIPSAASQVLGLRENATEDGSFLTPYEHGKLQVC